MRTTITTKSARMFRRLAEATTIAFVTIETGESEFVPESVHLVGWTPRRDRPLRLYLSADDAAALGHGLLRIAAAREES